MKKGNLILALASLGITTGLSEIAMNLFLNKTTKITPTKDGRIYALKANLNTTYAGVPLHTNKYGMRDQNYSEKVQKGIERILVAGDSHAFGFQVAEDQIFPTRLEEMLNTSVKGKRYEVLNAGVFGYDALQESEAVDYFMKRFEGIKTIIICGVENDVCIPEFIPTGYHSPIIELGKTAFAKVVGNSYEPKIGGLKRAPRDPETGLPVYNTTSAGKFRDYAGLNSIEMAYTRISKKAANQKARVLFFIDYDLIHPEMNEFGATDIEIKMEEIAKKAGFEIIDIQKPTLEYMKKHNLKYGDLRTKSKTHPNARGHRLLAEILYNHLSKK